MATPPPPYPDAPELADHWWWRPGWGIGTRFYAWHITVADLPALADHVAAYQQALRPYGFLDLIPREWLHITVQGLDHTHAVTDTQLDAVTHAVRHRLATIPAPVLTFAGPVLHREAVVIPPTDPGPLHVVRTAIRDAIEDTYGRPADSTHDRFRPHVSAAYVNAPADPGPVRVALDAAPVPPATLALTHVTLMEMHRDRRMYEWRTLTTAPFRPSPAPA